MTIDPFRTTHGGVVGIVVLEVLKLQVPGETQPINWSPAGGDRAFRFELSVAKRYVPQVSEKTVPPGLLDSAVVRFCPGLSVTPGVGAGVADPVPIAPN
jgi:hypothetical protein